MKISKFDIYMLTIIHVGLVLIITLLITGFIISRNIKLLKEKIEAIYVGEIYYGTLSFNSFTSDDSITLHSKVLDIIMLHEGFRSKPYKDISGNLTIGYGHKIQAHENLKKLSREEAYSLLEADFDKALKAAIRLSPNLSDPNNVFKRYAIAHFIFGKGVGAYSKSTLRKKVNKCENVDDEFRRWVYATVNGDKIKLTHLEKIAEWRINLYNK